MDSSDALSRSGYRERRLNNVYYIYIDQRSSVGVPTHLMKRPVHDALCGLILHHLSDIYINIFVH